ncbi:MAG TPA: AI-2E family transporter, partial [Cryptosporangiaceae bacterium]|nr:AI-2E family transporter [Cryptosporangiaceae bacterium]
MSVLARVRERTRDGLAAIRRVQLAPPEPDPVVVVEPLPFKPTVDDDVPRALRIAAAWSWRIIVLAVVFYGVLLVLGTLWVLVVPLLVALLLVALLQPAVSWLRRRGVPPSLAASMVMIAGIVAVVGTLAAVVQAFINGFPDLADQVRQGLGAIQTWLSNGPLQVSQAQVDDALQSAQDAISQNRQALTAGALSTAVTVGEVVTGFFLVLFSVFFMLRDGAKIWDFLVRMLPRRAQASVMRAGQYSWRTLVSYVRATVLVAFVDAVGISIGIAILQVPFVLPIGALIFLTAFIPLVGATLSGGVAILVALVAKGPVAALIVLAIVIVVMQLEGHVLQPLIMGRAVSLHPLAVIVAITSGFILAGIVGGLVAVPLLAVTNTAVRYLRRHPHGEPVHPLEAEPPGTR